MRIIAFVLILFLVGSVSVPYVHADRFSEWLIIWKKAEEQKAIKYQKEILHFDYSKIQGKDKGFKEPVKTAIADKKHIQNDKPIIFKVIKK